MDDIKVIFIAYNRPQYFCQCLESIKDQVMGMDVHLILDGPKEKQKTLQFGYEEDLKRIVENERLFREAFKSYPDIDKRIHKEESNLGCQRNVIKAYKFPFEELGAKYAIFFSEDSVYGDVFIEQIKILLDFCKDDDEIVLMSCCGSSRGWPPDILDRLYCKIVEPPWIGDSIWKREAYEIVKPHIEVFLDLWNSNLEDPRMELGEGWREFADKLVAYCKSIGIRDLQSVGAEDAFVAPILALNNKLRVSTAGEYLYNVGIDGEHSGLETNHPSYKKNIYPKVARELYIDKQYRGFQLQRIWAISEDWKEKWKKIIESTG
jgi:hypothetical protein